MTAPVITIFVDADACPVKDEVYRVAGRYDLYVNGVANSVLNVSREPRIKRVIVPDRSDAADDLITERVGADAIVITIDVPLMSRCGKVRERSLSPAGKTFTNVSIGLALDT